MSTSALRIRLEGQYEVVEAAVSRREAAARALARADWDVAMDWQLTDHAEVAQAVEQLRRRCGEKGSAEGRALLGRFERARSRVDGLLRERARALGEETEGEADALVQALRQHLPVAFATQHRQVWPLVALGVGLVVAVASWLVTAPAGPPPSAMYCAQPPEDSPARLVLPVGIAGVSVGLWWITRSAAPRALLTQRSLVLGDAIFRLDAIEEVRVGWWPDKSLFELQVVTAAGGGAPFHSFGSPFELLAALKAHHVKVVGV